MIGLVDNSVYSLWVLLLLLLLLQHWLPAWLNAYFFLPAFSFFICSFDGDKIDWDNKRLFYFLVHVQAQIHEICIFDSYKMQFRDIYFSTCRFFCVLVFVVVAIYITRAIASLSLYRCVNVQLNTKWLFLVCCVVFSCCCFVFCLFVDVVELYKAYCQRETK